MKVPFLLLLWLCIHICTCFSAPVRLIIDTDAGFDVDDVGAVAVANALADNNECVIIAIGHTNGFTKGIGAVSTLMNYHSRNDVPLGAYKGPWAKNPTAGKGNADRYISDLVDNYPSPIKDSSHVPTAVEVYRKALVNSPDNSVHIASIGITTNMRDLVLSPPDQYSPLNGTELISKKVNLIVWMDGMYNFGCAQAATDDWLGSDVGCHGSAQIAVMNWPSNVQQIFSSVGGDVLHGSWLDTCAENGNPIKQAFDDWGVGSTGRSSWDPITVMIAVRGAAGIHCIEIDQGGYMEVNEFGEETWNSPTATNTTTNTNINATHQSRISFENITLRSAISFELNQLLCKPNGQWSTVDWVQGMGENCYGPRGNTPAHGATDLEMPTSSSCGIMSESDCRQKCIDLYSCTGITTIPSTSDGDLVSCYRKSDVVLGSCDSNTKYTTWIRKKWYLAKGFNCYPNHGGDDIGIGVNGITVDACQQLCIHNCTGVVWKGADHSGVGDCWLKKNINLNKCDTATDFDTWLTSKNNL